MIYSQAYTGHEGLYLQRTEFVLVILLFLLELVLSCRQCLHAPRQLIPLSNYKCERKVSSQLSLTMLHCDEFEHLSHVPVVLY